MRTAVSHRVGAASAILGGGLWSLLWSFHTIAHGPKNPAPPDGTFLGYTAISYGRLLVVVASVPLLIFLIGLTNDARRKHQRSLVCGAVICLLGFILIVLAGVGIAAWVLYALGLAIVCAGLLLIGAARRAARTAPSKSWIVPLAMGLLVPALELARAPGSPLLGFGDIVGYLLLESFGLIFGLGWVAMGVMFAGVPATGE